jgi:hypothetical protein
VEANNKMERWVKFISSVVVIPAFIAMFIMVQNNSLAIARIEANMFTSDKWLAESKELALQLTSIWRQLADLRVEVASLPPVEFRERVNQLDTRVRDIEKREGRQP